MKQLYFLLLAGLCLVFSAGLTAQAGNTITFEENSSEFDQRTLELTFNGERNGRNSYRSNTSTDVFVDVQVFWDGARWVITDLNTDNLFVIYTNNYDVGPNPPSLDQGNWETDPGAMGDVLLRFEGNATQEINLAFTPNAGPFAENAGIQTGIGGGTPTGGVYTGAGVTDDGNGMTFTFDPSASAPGDVIIAYGAGNNAVTATIEVTEPEGGVINLMVQNGPGLINEATLSAGEIVNGKNSYEGVDNGLFTWNVVWQNNRWEVIVNNGLVVFVNNYDVGPTPPDLASGNWQELIDMVGLIQFDGSGTQFVTPAFTLSAGPFTTDDGVQAGLGGGTPTGGVYSGPGVTDDGNGMTFSFNPMAAGVGTATISYGDGPDGANNVTQTVEVTQAVDPLVAAVVVDSNATCFNAFDGGLTASATGGTPPYTYAWSNSATTASVTGVAAGTYSVTVTDADGMMSNASGTVTEPVELTVTVVSTDSDGNDNGTATATPSGGTEPYAYLWSDGQTTATATGLAGGMYSVTVTDANGCTAEGTVEVIDLAEVCVLESFDGQTPSAFSNVNGQNFTACSTGRITSIDFDVVTASTTVTLKLNKGINTEGEDYSQAVSFSETGRVRIELTEPFIVVEDSVYAFSLTDDTGLFDTRGSFGNPFTGGNFFSEDGQIPDVDLNFALIIDIDSSAVSTRPELLTSVANLTAFPNPTAGEFTVAYDLAQTSDVTVVLYDQQGRVLRKLVQGRQAVGAQRVTITDTSLPAGVLYYGLQTAKGHSAVKAIVVR